MARTMSAAALTALGAQQTSEVFLNLLDISLTIDGTMQHYHFVNNTQPITRRIANNTQPVTYTSTVYTPLGFKVVLPREGEEVTAATISIDVVDREVIEIMRKAEDIPTVSFIIILASNPDGDPEAGPFNFQLKKVSYNHMSLQAELSTGNHLDGAFPRVIKTPYFFPALF